MKSQREIRDSLCRQLQEKGASVAHFQDLVDSYLYFCQMEKKMQADVRKNGFTIPAISSQGHKYQKDNPAVKGAALYNRQKLSILKDMGLTTDSCRNPDDDDEL